MRAFSEAPRPAAPGAGAAFAGGGAGAGARASGGAVGQGFLVGAGAHFVEIGFAGPSRAAFGCRIGTAPLTRHTAALTPTRRPAAGDLPPPGGGWSAHREVRRAAVLPPAP